MPDWNRIKEHYRRNTIAIYEGGRNTWGIDPYAWDHEAGIELTPIERMLWSDIRDVGAVFYPQYPVAGFFVDFANPVARVGIECDGARYHVDVTRDENRQREIEANGWILYRISGSECWKDGRMVEDDSGRERWVNSYAHDFVLGIAKTHGLRVGRREREAA